MKRLLLFAIISIILFGISLLISVIAFPNWLTITNWSGILSKELLIAGLIFLANEFISLALTFLIKDTEFLEIIKYFFSNKYISISKRIDEITQIEIGKEKSNGKYIPNIFIESSEIKEKIRYFSEPLQFFQKIIEQTRRRLNYDYIVNILKQAHYPVDETIEPKITNRAYNHATLTKNITKYKEYLKQKSEFTSILIKEHGTGLKTDFKEKIPNDYSHIYDYLYPLLQFYRSYDETIAQSEENINLLLSKVIILKGNAGHGKTNLLCDFTENFLQKKNYIVLYLPAREFNFIGDQETIEQMIIRVFFSRTQTQFVDLLRFVKLKKPKSFLFIIIDGINEHKNIDLFSNLLEQFITRNSLSNLKIILSCRSEYFDERFINLTSIKNTILLDIDCWKYNLRIPNIHQKELITKYFEHFNIRLDLSQVEEKILSKFNKDKLLFRIFCEAYENEKPANYLNNLHKLEIFNKYFEKKLATIDNLNPCISEIINWMINHDEFINIQINNFSSETKTFIEATTYENVIIRKDLITIPDLALSKTEVINFVYDEFRDYLIASTIISNWETNKTLSITQIDKFSNSKYSIAEGLQRFLCLWAIKNENKELITFLYSKNWFNPVFISSICNSPNNLYTKFILDLLFQIFRTDPKSSVRLIYILTKNIDVNVNPIFNIELLISWLRIITEDEYRNVICTGLNTSYDYYSSHISNICSQIKEAFLENKVKSISTEKFALLLFQLIGVNDTYSKNQKVSSNKYPSYKTIIDISNSFDKEKLIVLVKSCIRINHNQMIIERLTQLLAYLVGEK